ncbi:TPA: P-type DNA transfer ATPase VirB11 [Legionella pneumophila]|nr:P-type DNA transfer ATPase VirB11 [Legionella pneumophila]HAT8332591.1 P-type DNA transfer ATPase VirB11 [Legionella pneumophila]
MEAVNACYLPGASGLLSPFYEFLSDPDVSEILINKPQELFIERPDGFTRVEMPVLTTQYLRRLFLLIANENKQILSETHPILSGTLDDGSRVQLIIPHAAAHETLSIRKFTLKQVTFQDYAAQGFFTGTKNAASAHREEEELLSLYQTQQWQQFLSQAINLKKNIIISGGTSSGKTTFLNSCIAEIPAHERLITLEDTYEVKLPHLNQVRLKAFKSVGEHTPQVTMQDLVQASLRLRPDRLIMGEIRGREVFDFISACSTGHSGSLATLHANNPKVAFMRMAQLYKLNQVAGMGEADIYAVLHEVIDIIVQLQKTASGRQLVEVYYKHAASL